MTDDRTALIAALARLVAAKDEKDAHGDTPRYRELKAGAWEDARAVLRLAALPLAERLRVPTTDESRRRFADALEAGREAFADLRDAEWDRITAAAPSPGTPVAERDAARAELARVAAERDALVAALIDPEMAWELGKPTGRWHTLDPFTWDPGPAFGLRAEAAAWVLGQARDLAAELAEIAGRDGAGEGRP